MMSIQPTEEKLIGEYLDSSGESIFHRWHDNLDGLVSSEVSSAVRKVRVGNMGNVKSVGGGVHEIMVDFGGGYRVYFGNVDGVLILLLGGGGKKRQDRDIADAKERWNYFKKNRGKVSDSKLL